MINKENQRLRISGIFGILGLTVVLVLLLATPWSQNWNESRVVKARQKAEILGYQLVQLYQESTKSTALSQKDSRSIASIDNGSVEFKPEGLMGRDPWGQPYRYTIQQSDADHIQVVIWSMGPNQKDDSRKNQADKNLFSAQSDDIQIVLNVPSHEF